MKRQNGLTLIEVLIAAMLLFVLLGLASVIFQQSVLVQDQSVKYAQFAIDQETVINRIRMAIDSGEYTGELSIGANAYQWSASQIASASTIVGAADNLSLMTSEQPITLYEVMVSGVGNPATYQFRIVQWQNSAG